MCLSNGTSLLAVRCPCKTPAGWPFWCPYRNVDFQHITVHRTTTSRKPQVKIRLAFHFVECNYAISMGPDALGNFCVFCEKICHHFRDTSAPGEFFSHQILSSITKLHRCRRPALERDKFVSGVKTVQILQFARHDLKKKRPL